MSHTITIVELDQLTQNLGLEDIASFESLIRRMCDDNAAAQMARLLVYWFPKAKKEGGWVFKSWRHWVSEIAITPAQIRRVHARGLLEKLGFVRKLMKANGAPTMHYNIDFDVLFARIAEFAGKTLEEVKALLKSVPAAAAAKNRGGTRSQRHNDGLTAEESNEQAIASMKQAAAKTEQALKATANKIELNAGKLARAFNKESAWFINNMQPQQPLGQVMDELVRVVEKHNINLTAHTADRIIVNLIAQQMSNPQQFRYQLEQWLLQAIKRQQRE